MIGLSASTYYRWQLRIYGCEYKGGYKCIVTKPTSLTLKEQELLIKYATAREFRTFSTVSLMYYCRRKNLLNISLESWYKYMNMYGINRTFFKRKRKRYKIGLRAKRKNQFWHIDMTPLIYGEKEKAYLSVIVDNYSRLIIGWRLSKKKTMSVTKSVLEKSFHFCPEFDGSLIRDAGTENTGSLPQKLLIGKGIKQLVAKKDIRFSNSMVEAVFRQMKQKFVKKNSKTYSSLYQLVYKFVRQYNEVIPHSSLDGGTPLEIYNDLFDKGKFKAALNEKLIESRKVRREKFYACYKCEKKGLRKEKVWA